MTDPYTTGIAGMAEQKPSGSGGMQTWQRLPGESEAAHLDRLLADYSLSSKQTPGKPAVTQPLDPAVLSDIAATYNSVTKGTPYKPVVTPPAPYAPNNVQPLTRKDVIEMTHWGPDGPPETHKEYEDALFKRGMARFDLDKGFIFPGDDDYVPPSQTESMGEFLEREASGKVDTSLLYPPVPPALVTPPEPPVVRQPVIPPAPTAPDVNLNQAASAQPPAIQAPPAPQSFKSATEAYQQGMARTGIPGADQFNREARRNAFMALAEFGLGLAGSKEATFGGAVSEAGLAGLRKYEQGRAGIAAQREAARREQYQRQRQAFEDARYASKEEYSRYRDQVADAQKAAQRSDTQAYRQKMLEVDLFKEEMANRRAQANAAAQAATQERQIRKEDRQAAKDRYNLLRDQLATITNPLYMNQISNLPEGQRAVAEAANQQQIRQLQDAMNAIVMVGGGTNQAPMPGVADLTK